MAKNKFIIFTNAQTQVIVEEQSTALDQQKRQLIYLNCEPRAQAWSYKTVTPSCKNVKGLC